MPSIPRKQKRRAYLPPKKAFQGLKKPNMKFYNSKAWRTTRKIYISSNPLCENCLEQGLTVEANVVDHITEINDGGAKLSLSNLRSLCHPCHNSKTGSRGAKTTNSKEENL